MFVIPINHNKCIFFDKNRTYFMYIFEKASYELFDAINAFYLSILLVFRPFQDIFLSQILFDMPKAQP